MQQKLNEKHQLIHDERDEWEAEKRLIRSKVAYDSEVVKLNIGGQSHLLCEKQLLTSVPESDLATLFNDMHELKKVNDEVFLDRNGKTFETLIDYLRNDRKVFPEFEDRNQENYFFKELHYWNIDIELREWQEQYLGTLNPEKVAHRSRSQMSASALNNPNSSARFGGLRPPSPYCRHQNYNNISI